MVINEVLGDELDLAKGDIIELGWYVSEDNSRKRVEGSFKVMEVVDNDEWQPNRNQFTSIIHRLAYCSELQKMNEVTQYTTQLTPTMTLKEKLSQ